MKREKQKIPTSKILKILQGNWEKFKKKVLKRDKKVLKNCQKLGKNIKNGGEKKKTKWRGKKRTKKGKENNKDQNKAKSKITPVRKLKKKWEKKKNNVILKIIN